MQQVRHPELLLLSRRYRFRYMALQLCPTDDMWRNVFPGFLLAMFEIFKHFNQRKLMMQYKSTLDTSFKITE